jgi:hypothetical protein
MDHANSLFPATPKNVDTSSLSLLRERAEIKVRSLRDAGSIRERNDLIQLQAAIIAMRAHDITNFRTCGDEEVDSPLRQVILVRRVDCWRTGGLRKSAAVPQVAI